ncbi:TULIP family P47-like protein [Sphingomonas abietis]|uniref:TULIP family P47-like protein n=1 Tax=Sphingomonas abietis TaxID=3012344 RepID=A0ABY7NPH6_9SPHN|nr:TULIP family P47-like protein [Sphingomonas abietis]WBO21381.1 TULIP family P47-like protein [Sphingomonas abietis]
MTLPAIRAADPPQGEISTFGWDTAFAVRIENVNAAIRARKASPASFHYADPVDPKLVCQGQFGDWQLVRGGDGDGVNVLLPLQNVTGVAADQASYTDYRWAGGSLTFTVRLHFFEGPETSSRHLKIKPTSDEPSVPVVQYYATDETVAPSPAWAIYAIQAALEGWCTQNLADFAYIFSVADLNEEADKGAWSFLKPSYVSYSYVDGPSDADAFLGVLAMTNGRAPGSLQQVIDKRIVPPGVEGAFCISRALMLLDLVVPQLMTMWPNLTMADLIIGDQTITLTADAAIDLPQVQEQGDWYTPVLKQFTFAIEGPQISIDAYTETDVQAGVTAWCRTTSCYTIVKGTNKAGQTTLAYRQLGDPIQSHGNIVAEWVKITDAIVAAILAIALVVLAVVTGGAAAPVIVVLGALLVGAVGFSAEIAGLIANDDAPAIDLLQDNIYAPIVWTDSQDFAVSDVMLDGSLRLVGALGFASTVASPSAP